MVLVFINNWHRAKTVGYLCNACVVLRWIYVTSVDWVFKYHGMFDDAMAILLDNPVTELEPVRRVKVLDRVTCQYLLSSDPVF